MPTYPTYKLGEIIDKVSVVCKVKQKEYLTDGLYPVIDQGQPLIGGYTDDENLLVKTELPVLVFGDHTKVKKYVDFPFVAGADGTKIIRPKKEYFVEPKLFYWFLHCVKFPDKGYARHFQYLLKSDIAVPPLSTQHQIVSRIESLFAELDKAEEHLRTAQQQLKTYKQAVLNHWLNNEDEEWEKKTAEECVVDENYSLAIGPFGSDLKVEDYTESGVKLVFVRDITSKFKDKKNKFVSEYKADQLKAHNVFKGDLLITKMGDPPGQTGIFPFDRGVITSDVLRMKTNDKILNKYYAMYYILSSEGGKQIKEMTQGVAQKKISLGRFKKFLFPVPEISEQQRIVEEIESRLSQAEAAEARIAESLQKTEALRQSILKKAFCGELV